MAEGDQFFLASSATGERFELTGDTSVGRSDECDLVVSEGQPSRQHAKVTIEGSDVFVEDLNSTNGTFLNGTQISEKQQLNHGDEVVFDVNKFKLEVQLAAQLAGDATVLREVDPGKTVLRPILKEPEVAVTPPAEPVAVAPVAAPEPAPQAVVAGEPKPKQVKPGSWADPNEKNASSTQFFSPEDLASMRGGTVAEKVESDVPYLQVTTGNAAGSLIQLIADGAKKEWTIGGAEGRDIVFADQGVSDFHTLLVHESGRWKLVDQMSTNGTFINNSKTISGYLNSGDKIRIGTVNCSFVLPGNANNQSKAKDNSGKKIWASVAVFVAVLAALFGAYFLL